MKQTYEQLRCEYDKRLENHQIYDFTGSIDHDGYINEYKNFVVTLKEPGTRCFSFTVMHNAYCGSTFIGGDIDSLVLSAGKTLSWVRGKSESSNLGYFFSKCENVRKEFCEERAKSVVLDNLEAEVITQEDANMLRCAISKCLDYRPPLSHPWYEAVNNLESGDLWEHDVETIAFHPFLSATFLLWFARNEKRLIKDYQYREWQKSTSLRGKEKKETICLF